MTARDSYQGAVFTLDAPASSAVEVTPSDSVELERVSRAVWIGGEGDLHVKMQSGDGVTFTNMNVGWHPIRVSQIFATGTDATGIVAVW